MAFDELSLQNLAPALGVTDGAPARRPRLRDRLLRWKVPPEPLTNEEQHHLRQLERARRHREAEMLRQTAMWMALRPF
ncbi:hypothetical protein [Microbacterium hibisci]|uniref:hypothetical protein n=1 Tax=Microbacterium hibisci TaxID=2036000 RepID=UPI00194598C9|nr:hypothetical protein [Microbacterium hibisci]